MRTAICVCSRCKLFGDVRSGYCETCVHGSHFIERCSLKNKGTSSKDKSQSITTPINYSFDDFKDTDISKELVMILRNMINTRYGYDARYGFGGTNYGSFYGMNRRSVGIVKVIFNDPATIVIWSDGQKTVVKTQNGDEFDPEKGLAMAISKRVLGNQGNYYEEFKKWLPEYEDIYDVNESESTSFRVLKITPETIKRALNIPDDVFNTIMGKSIMGKSSDDKRD